MAGLFQGQGCRLKKDERVLFNQAAPGHFQLQPRVDGAMKGAPLTLADDVLPMVHRHFFLHIFLETYRINSSTNSEELIFRGELLNYRAHLHRLFIKEEVDSC